MAHNTATWLTVSFVFLEFRIFGSSAFVAVHQHPYARHAEYRNLGTP